MIRRAIPLLLALVLAPGAARADAMQEARALSDRIAGAEALVADLPPAASDAIPPENTAINMVNEAGRFALTWQRAEAPRVVLAADAVVQRALAARQALLTLSARRLEYGALATGDRAEAGVKLAALRAREEALQAVDQLWVAQMGLALALEAAARDQERDDWLRASIAP